MLISVVSRCCKLGAEGKSRAKSRYVVWHEASELTPDLYANVICTGQCTAEEGDYCLVVVVVIMLTLVLCSICIKD